jgi:hypothetical protein
MPQASARRVHMHTSSTTHKSTHDYVGRALLPDQTVSNRFKPLVAEYLEERASDLYQMF